MPTSSTCRASNISSRLNLCEGRQHPEGIGLDPRRPVGDEGAGALSRADDAHGREPTQARTDRGAAHSDM